MIVHGDGRDAPAPLGASRVVLVPREMGMTLATRRVVGIVAGGVTAIALALTATLLARWLWPAYAAAEPSRAYSVGMLVLRLTVGVMCTAGAAVVTTRVVRDGGRAAWWLGALGVVLSLPDHLFRVWAAYPVWYHAVYLAFLVPVAGLAGRLTTRWARAHAAGSHDR
jgi:hypothetical protein